MKRVLLAAGLLYTGVAFAQTSQRTTAYNNLEDYKTAMFVKDVESAKNSLMKAKEAIDKAAEHEKTKVDPRTFLYKGQIYMGLAQLEQNDGASHVETAVGAFKKAKELDTKSRYTNKVNEHLTGAQQSYFGMGAQSFGESKFDVGMQQFEMAAKIAEAGGMIDTNSIYNAGLCAERSQNWDKAIVFYQKCADIDYMSPTMYSTMANIYNDQDKKEEALKMVQAGRAKHPKDARLLIDELNHFLLASDFEKAESLLTDAIANDPENVSLYTNAGVVYERLKDFNKSMEMYKKALELDPNSVDANYGVGSTIYNNATEKLNAANDLSFEEAAKVEDEAMTKFKEALPYFEKVRELNPDDKQNLNALFRVYSKLKMNKERDEVKDLLRN